jgi:hypothetical protein
VVAMILLCSQNREYNRPHGHFILLPQFACLLRYAVRGTHRHPLDGLLLGVLGGDRHYFGAILWQLLRHHCDHDDGWRDHGLPRCDVA